MRSKDDSFGFYFTLLQTLQAQNNVSKYILLPQVCCSRATFWVSILPSTGNLNTSIVCFLAAVLIHNK